MLTNPISDVQYSPQYNPVHLGDFYFGRRTGVDA